jgi:1-aminocyclopropane-1-carboxylate deaminase/D-cysteine desulfhydrase-like pyridoxal-dependent ACC family enzyme
LKISVKIISEWKNTALVPLGGSVPLGAHGLVRGVEEPKRQLDAMNVEIDYIFHHHCW